MEAFPKCIKHTDKYSKLYTDKETSKPHKKSNNNWNKHKSWEVGSHLFIGPIKVLFYFYSPFRFKSSQGNAVHRRCIPHKEIREQERYNEISDITDHNNEEQPSIWETFNFNNLEPEVEEAPKIEDVQEPKNESYELDEVI